MTSFLSPQLRRLLSYVRPYRFRMAFGVVLLGFVALAEGIVALMIAPMVDRVHRNSLPEHRSPAPLRSVCSLARIGATSCARERSRRSLTCGFISLRGQDLNL